MTIEAPRLSVTTEKFASCVCFPRLDKYSMATSSATTNTRRKIELELRALNETLSFAAPTSSLQHAAKTHDRDRLPLSQSLPRHSQLRTVSTLGQSPLKAAQSGYLNQLGTTALPASMVSSLSLANQCDGAEYRALCASGVLETAQQQQAAAKAMTSRDTVNLYLHMKDTPSFTTDYRSNYQFTQETKTSLSERDKSHVGLFKLDEFRVYVETANKYKAWPLMSGVPPWPPRKTH